MKIDDPLSDVLRSAVERASSGRAVALRLSGRRGSGRSWWLARARTIAETAGMTALVGGGVAAERDLPFGTLATLLRPLRNVSVDADTDRVIADVLDHRPTDIRPIDVHLAVFRLLCRAATDRPVCLLVDDLDDTDTDTVQALTFTARRADADALMLVTAADADATTPFTTHRIPTMAVDALVAQIGRAHV